MQIAIVIFNMEQKQKIKLIFGIFLLILGFMLNYLSSNYLAIKDLDCPKNPDIFLDLFKEPHPNYMIILEIFIVVIIALFVFLNRKNIDILLDSLIVFGLFNILRGIMLPLTILGGLESYSLLKEYNTFSFGLFPSGHSSIPAIFLFLTKNKKFLFSIFLIITAIFLIISQQHYTIDIISSIIFVYAIKSAYEKNIR